jgi:hypothetical protein
MTITDNDREQIYKLAYEEAMKGVAGQDSTLTTIRKRAISLGGLSGLIATFLGKEALKSGALDKPFSCELLFGCLGITSLILSIIIIIDIIRPRDGWIFHSSARSIISQFAEGKNAQTIGKTYKYLAEFGEDNYSDNETILNKLFIRFYIAIVTVLFQSICWLLLI